MQVYPGNTGDPSTVPDQVDTLKKRFALERVILVGDRGMLTQTQIDALRQFPGIGWISALRSEKIRVLRDAFSGHFWAWRFCLRLCGHGCRMAWSAYQSRSCCHGAIGSMPPFN